MAAWSAQPRSATDSGWRCGPRTRTSPTHSTEGGVMSSSPNMTRHARERWAERFPSLNLKWEYEHAQPCGAKRRAKIREQCRHHAHLLTGQFRGKYFRLSPSGVVFVMAPQETVVTVFPYEGSLPTIPKLIRDAMPQPVEAAQKEPGDE